MPHCSFDVSFLTIVPFFQVTESVPIRRRDVGGGQAQQVAKSTMMRRDLKLGVQSAFAEEVSSGNSVRLCFDWGEPGPGTLQEVYVMDPVG